MNSATRRELKIVDALAAGGAAGELTFKAKARRTRRPPRRKSFLSWIRHNLAPLAYLTGLATSVMVGAWTVFTYYHPSPYRADSPAVVEPYDPHGRNQTRSPGRERVPEPRDKPEVIPKPEFRLLIDNVQRGTLSRPVQHTLKAASFLLQDGLSEEQVNQMTLAYLSKLGYVDQSKSAVQLVWKDWRTLEVVPAPATFKPLPTLVLEPKQDSLTPDIKA